MSSALSKDGDDFSDVHAKRDDAVFTGAYVAVGVLFLWVIFLTAGGVYLAKKNMHMTRQTTVDPQYDNAASVHVYHDINPREVSSQSRNTPDNT